MENATNIAKSSKATIPAGNIPEKAPRKSITISPQTYISAIHSAAMSSKFALNLELAVGLSIFNEAGIVTRESRQQLVAVYSEAGYSCKTMHDPDYKTVMRRVSVAAELFNFVGHEKVAEWADGLVEMAIIQGIRQKLEEYGLRSINSVLQLVGKPVVRPAPAEPSTAPTKAHQGTLMGQAMDKALEAKKAAKEPPERVGWKVLEKNGVHMEVPPTATREQVFGAAMSLLEYSNTLGEAKKPTAKVAAKKAAVVTH